jgi:hypothetical protein
MAVTQNTYTGDGTTVLFSFTFPYLETTDIKVSVNGIDTTAYTLANATTVQFNVAPAIGAAVRIYRLTLVDNLAATFYPGSSIRSEDLNQNFTQNLYLTQENNNYTIKDVGLPQMVARWGFNYPPTAPEPTSNTELANKLYVDQKAFTGSGIGDGNKGDITVSSTGSTWLVNNLAVTNQKLAGGIALSKLTQLKNATTTGVSKTLAPHEFCTVTAAGLTLTLPASPTSGDAVGISISGNITDTSISRNGQLIMGLAENLTINLTGVGITLVYSGATYGWRLF